MSWKKLLLGVVLGLLGVLALGAAWLHHLGKVHRHCIQGAGLAFRVYADKHQGNYPVHTNGFGDALLLLVKEGCLEDVHTLCGPLDDGHVLREALTNGLPVPEAQCTRVYVQGLSMHDDSELCLLFDRDSHRGGDHSYGTGKPLREVLMADAMFTRIIDEKWPAFVSNQVRLLKAKGVTLEQIRRYYPEGK
jgi:hypothetical protein